MLSANRIRKIEGKQTVESVADILDVKKSTAMNYLSELKQANHATVTGGGPQQRIYTITRRKQRERDKGMYDLINTYSPMQVNPPYDHQVHGPYSEEEAIVDAIQTASFRTILASLRLFNHVTDWKRLYHYARDEEVWQEVGALYEVARQHVPVRNMPKRYLKKRGGEWKQLTQLKEQDNYPTIAEEWKVYIPFNEHDVEAIT